MDVSFHTNLDMLPGEKWPSTLPCRPIKGDIITSNTGLELEVVRVSFKQVEPRVTWTTHDSYGTSGDKSACYTELHLPKNRFKNLDEFYKWYKSRSIKEQTP